MEKLDQILDQAMLLVAAEGSGALTLGRLAEAMSVTPAALYRYFSSKDELIARLQNKSLAELSAMITRSRAAWARSALIQHAAPRIRPLVALFAVARLYVRLREADSPHIQLIADIVGDSRPVVSDEWARRVAPQWMALLDGTAEIIGEAEALGAISPGKGVQRAALLWASIHGVAQTQKLRRLAPNVFSIRELAREVAAGLALRWGATPSDIDDALAVADRLRIRLPPT